MNEIGKKPGMTDAGRKRSAQIAPAKADRNFAYIHYAAQSKFVCKEGAWRLDAL